MKKMIVVLAAAAVAGVASADLTSWKWTGGVVSPSLAAADYVDGGLTFNNDLSLAPSYTGTTINIADIAGLIGSSTLTVGPAFFGGVYSVAQINDDASKIGDAFLVIDSNGGGIQVGDIIGLGASGSIVELDPGGVPPALTQSFEGGDITTGITVVGIPEPATLGLMGIAGLGMFLARKKARH